jgi:UDP-N-acetylmuramoylalanine--D-glutamate ligase
MSCHQLAHVNVSPHVAVFLNLFEEHLDYYKTFDRYFAAKANITRYQTAGDILFDGQNVPALSTLANEIRIDAENVPDYDLKVLGHHNDLNAHFVFMIASKVYGIDAEAIKNALRDFSGLPHRLMHIGTLDGIDYYDDSISTIPSATIEAIGAVPNAATVLIGGMDRGINYDTLIDFVNSNTKYNYIFSYDSGKRIYDSIVKTDNCIYKETLAEAVERAKSITRKGDAVILSPAAASYGYFKNFEERGDVFRQLCGL